MANLKGRDELLKGEMKRHIEYLTDLNRVQIHH